MTIAEPATQMSVPLPDRTCGTCTLCCKVMPIRALNKPVGRWCSHCKPGTGCGIHDSRPSECGDFFCMWMLERRLGPEWKPEKCKLVLTGDAGGKNLMVRCDPGFPQAWRAEPYHTAIKQWSIAARGQGGVIIVTAGMNATVIAPEGEFPVGAMQEGDRIHLDFSGARLRQARVIKEGEAGPQQ